MDRTELAALEGEIKGMEDGIKAYPALAAIAGVSIAAKKAELAKGRQELELALALEVVAVGLPLDNESLSNVLFRRVLKANTSEAGNTVETFTWVAQVNHACQLKAKGNSTVTTSETGRSREIVLSKIEGERLTNPVTYANSADGCRAHGVDFTGNSPVRALEAWAGKNGYIVRKS